MSGNESKRQVIQMDVLYGIKDAESKDLGRRISAVLEEFEMHGFEEDNPEAAAIQISVAWLLLGEDETRYNYWVELYNADISENSAPWPSNDQVSAGQSFHAIFSDFKDYLQRLENT